MRHTRKARFHAVATDLPARSSVAATPEVNPTIPAPDGGFEGFTTPLAVNSMMLVKINLLRWSVCPAPVLGKVAYATGIGQLAS